MFTRTRFNITLHAHCSLFVLHITSILPLWSIYAPEFRKRGATPWQVLCSLQSRSITSHTFGACPGVSRVIKGCREKEDNKHILAQNFLLFPIVCMEQFLSTSSGLLLLIHLSLYDHLHRKWSQIKVKLEYFTYSKRVWNKWLCNFH